MSSLSAIHGFWGPVTSTIDWCEANYQHTSYIAETFNTFSNLFYIVPAAYGLYLSTKYNSHYHFHLLYLLLLGIGIGSFAFHGTLLREMQAFDELPMIAWINVVFFGLMHIRHIRTQNCVTVVEALQSPRSEEKGSRKQQTEATTSEDKGSTERADESGTLLELSNVSKLITHKVFADSFDPRGTLFLTMWAFTFLTIAAYFVFPAVYSLFLVAFTGVVVGSFYLCFMVIFNRYQFSTPVSPKQQALEQSLGKQILFFQVSALCFWLADHALCSTGHMYLHVGWHLLTSLAAIRTCVMQQIAYYGIDDVEYKTCGLHFLWPCVHVKQ